jgi:regulator of sigma E protease
METIIMVGQLLLALTIMIGLHEFGHLWAAKAFGMRVEKYYVGFPPKLFGKKIGETEYALGAIPLGGFVKISGMIDESLDTKNLSAEPEPWEFRAKPAWQRLIVMMGGIIINVITGIVVFICLTYVNGEEYLTKEELNKHGIVAEELGQEIGLQTGDRILDISGKDYAKFNDLVSPDVLLGSNVYYTVLRDDNTLTINIPNDFIEKFSGNRERSGFIAPRMPFNVGMVTNGPAKTAGLLPGDNILNVNGQPIFYFDEMKTALQNARGEEVVLVVNRNGETKELSVQVTEEGTIGFQMNPILDYEVQKYGIGQSLTKGTATAFSFVWYNIKGFGKMFSGEVNPRKSLAGPIGIAKQFGTEWVWERFWRLVGLISMILAFMNFLPIPALDGGHVMFLTWEIVTGRKPSDKFLENAQKVGMVILLALMVFIIGNDILNLF